MNPPDDDRPFPEESEWLDLQLPEPLPENPSESPRESPRESPPAGARRRSAADDFVSRTLQALAADRELDRQILRLDEQLPNALLQQFAAPLPSRRFAERTLQALDDARRQHWQQLLARHVAPEPSPQFVARTLQALAAEPGAPRPRAGLHRAGLAHRHGPHHRRGRLPLLLAAAAAAALFSWFAWSRDPLLPLEVRFDARSSPAFAFHHGGSPLAAVLAEATASTTPWALSDAGADGLWLSLAEAR